VKTEPIKTPSTIYVVYRAVLAPFLKVMDKLSGRDVDFERKSKKAA